MAKPMEPFDLDEEELKSLLGAAGRVAPPRDFTREVMTRVANEPVPAPAPARWRWERAPHRVVALVLPGMLLGSMVLLLAALRLPGGSPDWQVISPQWLDHPLTEALSRPATLIALLSLAVAVWVLVGLERKIAERPAAPPAV